jgi:sec-independent protein translocase protein TatC
MKSSDKQGEMTLWEHLQELRTRLIRSIIGILIASIVSYVFWRDIWNFLTIPLKKLDVQLINTTPVEAFITSIKVAIISGIVFSSPWILWNFWKFVAPGLFKNEKTLLFPTLFFSVALFLTGAGFCYYAVLPYGLSFLANYAVGEEIAANWRQGDYATFIMRVLLAFGITFELPIVSLVLSKLGIIDAKMLWSFSRYALIVIFILAALLTPPDPVTQILLAIPLFLIYVISILISYFITKGKKEE